MGHTGVGWVMKGWGGSCRGGVGHASVGWCGSCRSVVGHAVHVGVGWGGLITHTFSKIHKWL